MSDDSIDVDAMVIALRYILEQLTEAPSGSLRRIPLKAAAYIAGISDAQMRRKCEQNPFGTMAGGYGLKKNGTRWEVVIAPFIATLPVSALLRFRDINRAWMTG